jgi:hypothetical protein
MNAPDGFFINDLLVYHDLDSRGFATRGFSYEGPDLRNASRSVLLDFKQACRRLLRSIDLKTELKFHWSVDSDYKDTLQGYAKASEKCPHGSWEQFIRDQKLNQYWNKMRERKLRRERCRIYISKRIEADPPTTLSGAKLQEHYNKVVAELSFALQHHGNILSTTFSPLGSRTTPLSQIEQFAHCNGVLNPSHADRFDSDPGSIFKPLQSLQQNCYNAQAVAGPDKQVHFYYDGYFHNLLVLRKDRPPDPTLPGILWHLTNLPFLDYSITATIRKLDPETEKKSKEATLDRLKAEYADEGRESTVTSIDKLKRQVRNIAQGNVIPLEAELIVHLWAPTVPELISRTNIAKAAFNKMNGAQYYDISLSSTVKHLWYNTWPGFCFSPYRHYFFYAEDDWLADLLPIGSSFTGHSGEVEALYDGDNGSLVSVSTFVDNTPQLAACFGMSRAGKDVFICDLLTQTQPYYDFTFIAEEGLSQGTYSQLNGCDPIILRPDSEFTLNYFDTHGLPLTGLQKAAAAALCAKMIGTVVDEDKQNRRVSQLTQYINALYDEIFDDWAREHEAKIPQLARMAIAILAFQKKHLPPGTTFLEAYVEFRDQLDAVKDEALSLLHGISEAKITDFLLDPTSQSVVKNCAFACFTPEMYPRHEQLCMLMRNPFREHHAKDIHEIRDLLQAWCAVDGTHGRLVDGVRNINLQGKVVHFELGHIPESSKDLKAVAHFLVANDVRQHIISMRRGARKRVYFGEASRILGIPGGDHLISEFYAQLSKFSVWILSTVQQYAMFKNSKIRPIVMGNSSMFFFLRMNDRHDLADLSRDVDLPEVTQNNILSYPRPMDLPSHDKYASLTYHHLDAVRPVCGTIRNRVSREMLYVANSTGSEFEKRAQALKRYPSVMEGVLAEARATTAQPQNH